MRSAILETAAGLFDAKGFADTSLNDIGRGMNISRASIYYYFRNKEEILAALVDEVTTAAANLVTVSPKDKSYAKQLHTLVYNASLWFIAHRHGFRLLHKNEAILPPELAARNADGRRRVFRGWRELIRTGIEAGEFRPVDEGTAAFAVIGMVTWAAWWVDERTATAPRRIALTFAEFAVNALVRTDHSDRAGDDITTLMNRLQRDLASLQGQLETSKDDNDSASPDGL
jgi:AcrR family transcriptional regulator